VLHTVTSVMITGHEFINVRTKMKQVPVELNKCKVGRWTCNGSICP